MNLILLPLLTQPHVLLQVGFFKSCVIHSFNTHLTPSSHSAHWPWTATSIVKGSSLTLVSFWTKGLLGVAESTVFNNEGNPSSCRECVRQGGWGVMDKRSSPALNHDLLRTFLSRRTFPDLQNLLFQLFPKPHKKELSGWVFRDQRWKPAPSFHWELPFLP